MYSCKDEEAFPRVEILLREQEQLPTRRRRCSEESVRHPSRDPLTDSGVVHDTLEGRTTVGPCGRRHSHALRLPVLKATELPISRACAAIERSPHLTDCRGPTRHASSRLRWCLLPRRLRYSAAQSFPICVASSVAVWKPRLHVVMLRPRLTNNRAAKAAAVFMMF